MDTLVRKPIDLKVSYFVVLGEASVEKDLYIKWGRIKQEVKLT